MSVAQLVRLGQALGITNRRVRAVAAEVYPFAAQSKDRAYQYMDFCDGSRLRVVVQPSGLVRLDVIHGRRGRKLRRPVRRP